PLYNTKIVKSSKKQNIFFRKKKVVYQLRNHLAEHQKAQTHLLVNTLPVLLTKRNFNSLGFYHTIDIPAFN
ncbi:MAG: hypothetical protein ACRDE7_06825, partial [Sphingobacterium sp.]